MDGLREDQAQIGEVLVRYATGIDRRDWDLFRTCFRSDAIADYGVIGQFSGIDALTDFMISVHDAMGDTHHRLSNFVIDVDVDGDPDKATARSYMHAVLIATRGDPSSWIDAVGHCDDTFVRTADGWRISHRVVYMSRVMTASGVL